MRSRERADGEPARIEWEPIPTNTYSTDDIGLITPPRNLQQAESAQQQNTLKSLGTPNVEFENSFGALLDNAKKRLEKHSKNFEQSFASIVDKLENHSKIVHAWEKEYERVSDDDISTTGRSRDDDERDPLDAYNEPDNKRDYKTATSFASSFENQSSFLSVSFEGSDNELRDEETSETLDLEFIGVQPSLIEFSNPKNMYPSVKKQDSAFSREWIEAADISIPIMNSTQSHDAACEWQADNDSVGISILNNSSESRKLKPKFNSKTKLPPMIGADKRYGKHAEVCNIDSNIFSSPLDSDTKQFDYGFNDKVGSKKVGNNIRINSRKGSTTGSDNIRLKLGNNIPVSYRRKSTSDKLQSKMPNTNQTSPSVCGAGKPNVPVETNTASISSRAATSIRESIPKEENIPSGDPIISTKGPKNSKMDKIQSRTSTKPSLSSDDNLFPRDEEMLPSNSLTMSTSIHSGKSNKSFGPKEGISVNNGKETNASKFQSGMLRNVSPVNSLVGQPKGSATANSLCPSSLKDGSIHSVKSKRSTSIQSSVADDTSVRNPVNGQKPVLPVPCDSMSTNNKKILYTSDAQELSAIPIPTIVSSDSKTPDLDSQTIKPNDIRTDFHVDAMSEATRSTNEVINNKSSSDVIGKKDEKVDVKLNTNSYYSKLSDISMLINAAALGYLATSNMKIPSSAIAQGSVNIPTKQFQLCTNKSGTQPKKLDSLQKREKMLIIGTVDAALRSSSKDIQNRKRSDDEGNLNLFLTSDSCCKSSGNEELNDKKGDTSHAASNEKINILETSAISSISVKEKKESQNETLVLNDNVAAIQSGSRHKKVKDSVENPVILDEIETMKIDDKVVIPSSSSNQKKSFSDKVTVTGNELTPIESGPEQMEMKDSVALPVILDDIKNMKIDDKVVISTIPLFSSNRKQSFRDKITVIDKELEQIEVLDHLMLPFTAKATFEGQKLAHSSKNLKIDDRGKIPRTPETSNFASTSTKKEFSNWKTIGSEKITVIQEGLEQIEVVGYELAKETAKQSVHMASGRIEELNDEVNKQNTEEDLMGVSDGAKNDFKTQIKAEVTKVDDTTSDFNTWDETGAKKKKLGIINRFKKTFQGNLDDKIASGGMDVNKQGELEDSKSDSNTVNVDTAQQKKIIIGRRLKFPFAQVLNILPKTSAKGKPKQNSYPTISKISSLSPRPKQILDEAIRCKVGLSCQTAASVHDDEANLQVDCKGQFDVKHLSVPLTYKTGFVSSTSHCFENILDETKVVPHEQKRASHKANIPNTRLVDKEQGKVESVQEQEQEIYDIVESHDALQLKQEQNDTCVLAKTSEIRKKIDLSVGKPFIAENQHPTKQQTPEGTESFKMEDIRRKQTCIGEFSLYERIEATSDEDIASVIARVEPDFCKVLLSTPRARLRVDEVNGGSDLKCLGTQPRMSPQTKKKCFLKRLELLSENEPTDSVKVPKIIHLGHGSDSYDEDDVSDTCLTHLSRIKLQKRVPRAKHLSTNKCVEPYNESSRRSAHHSHYSSPSKSSKSLQQDKKYTADMANVSSNLSFRKSLPLSSRKSIASKKSFTSKKSYASRKSSSSRKSMSIISKKRQENRRPINCDEVSATDSFKSVGRSFDDGLSVALGASAQPKDRGEGTNQWGIWDLGGVFFR